MISAITEWIRGIVFVVLFAAFLDLLLPNSSMQKFVRLIMGLFIMLAVLNPVIDFVAANPDNAEIPAAVLSGDKLPETAGLSQNALFKREQLTREYYAKDLARQIRATTLALEGVSDAKVTVKLKEPPSAERASLKTPPQIARLEILVEAEKETASLRVNSLPLNITAPQNAAAKSPLTPAAENKIKRAIAELYQLKSEVIEVGAL